MVAPAVPRSGRRHPPQHARYGGGLLRGDGGVGPARIRNLQLIEAWRICLARHASTAWSGAGTRANGGRWNSIGVAIVYASSTLSLAALENLVHADSDL